jgi:hypothetical protein
LAVERTYEGCDWQDIYLETGEQSKVLLTDKVTRQLVSGTGSGIAKGSGWLLDMEAVNIAGVFYETIQILENFTHTLISLRRAWADSRLLYVEVMRLSPEK